MPTQMWFAPRYRSRQAGGSQLWRGQTNGPLWSRQATTSHQISGSGIPVERAMFRTRVSQISDRRRAEPDTASHGSPFRFPYGRCA